MFKTFVFLFLVSLLFFPQTLDFQHFHVRKLAGESEADLGRETFPSAFDLVLKEKNGGKIPSTIEKLAELLGPVNMFLDDTQNDFPAVATLIPFGRSVQRGHTDFTHPRIIYAFYSKHGPFFVGYSQRTKSAELISWVPDLRRFRYELIHNFAGPNKFLRSQDKSLASRDLCLGCHQHGGPIFPRAPWREMVEKSVKDGLLAAHPTKTYHGIEISDSIPVYTIRANLFDNMLRYANILLQAGQVVGKACGENTHCQKLVVKLAILYPVYDIDPMNNLRRNGRGKMLRNLLQVLLSNSHREVPSGFLATYQTNFNARLSSPPFYRELEAILAPFWPADGFAYPSAVLLDRELGRANLFQGFHIPMRLTANGEEASFDESVANFVFTTTGPFQETVLENSRGQGDIAQNQEEIPQTNAEVGNQQMTELRLSTDAQGMRLLNPRRERPLTQKILAQDAAKYIALTAALSLGILEENIDELRRLIGQENQFHRSSTRISPGAVESTEDSWFERYVRSRIEAAIDSAQFFQVLQIFKAELPPKSVLLDAIKKIIQGEATPLENYRKIAEQRRLSPEFFRLQAEGNPWQRACLRCHGPQDEIPLPLSNMTELRRYRAKIEEYRGKSIREIVELDLMPFDQALDGLEKDEALDFLESGGER